MISARGIGLNEGVLYDGMTADGSKVFFTTKEPSAPPHNQDTDESADIYAAEVSANAATLTRISTGSEGAGNYRRLRTGLQRRRRTLERGRIRQRLWRRRDRRRWGSGRRNGSIYFLSPEKLVTAAAAAYLSGEEPQNQPNLYLAAPGSAPHFIATLSPEDPRGARCAQGSRDPAHRRLPGHAERGIRGVSRRARPLTGYDNAGHSEVYRYDAASRTA